MKQIMYAYQKNLTESSSEKDIEIQLIQSYSHIYTFNGNHENSDLRFGLKGKPEKEGQIEAKKNEKVEYAIVQNLLTMAKSNRSFFYAVGVNKKELKYIIVPELLQSGISLAALANGCKPSSREKEFQNIANCLISNRNWKLYDGMPPEKELEMIALCREADRKPELLGPSLSSSKKVLSKTVPFWRKTPIKIDQRILELVKYDIETQKKLEAYYTPEIYEKESFSLMKNFKYPCDPSCGKDAIFVNNKFPNFVASDIDEKICNSIITHRNLLYYKDNPPTQCDCYYTNPPFSLINELLDMAEKQKKVIGIYMPVYKLPKKSMPCIGGFLMWSQIEWSLSFKFLLGFFVFDFKNGKPIKNIKLKYLPTNEDFFVEFEPPADAYIFENCIPGPQRFAEDGWNNLKDSPFYQKVVYKNKLFRKFTGEFIKEKFIQECKKPEYSQYMKKTGNSGGGKKKKN